MTRLQPGDEVFGSPFMRGFGALAEWASVSGDLLGVKPANLSFGDTAAVPVGAMTALQGLRDHGQVERGHKVLIIGASGGVGTFAVQIAKQLGAEVTGVCSTRNLDMVRSLGADHVIAARTGEDLQSVKELIEAGEVSPVIDRRYSLAETPEAIRYLEEGHARGKVVIDV